MATTSNTLPQTEICHRVSCRVRELNGRTLGNIATQPLPKIGSVICVDLSVEALRLNRARLAGVSAHPKSIPSDPAFTRKDLFGQFATILPRHDPL
jgi:hypothetical protein